MAVQAYYVLLVLALATLSLATSNPLEDYVFAPDPSYNWQRESTFSGPGYTGHVLKLTSQTWLSSPQVSDPVWVHWLVIGIPDTVNFDTAFLFIGEGSNPLNSPPTAFDPGLALPVLEMGSIYAHLYQVPNQPLSFRDDPFPQPRVEDQIIAFTWWDFVHNLDPSILLRLPMVKAAVRAMDAVQEFVEDEAENNGLDASVECFVVGGASKRGWTTWLTPIDHRVVGIVPIVIDVLNVVKSINHHWRAYGFFSFAIADYVSIGYTGYLNTPENAALMRIVDPFNYRFRFTIPKFIVNSAGDEFFLPDSSRFYYNRLRGQKHLRYVPNSGHLSAGFIAIESIATWYHAFLNNIKVPKVYSHIDRDTGKIIAFSFSRPTKVLLWTAVNPNARVFRANPNPVAWTSTPVRRLGLFFVANPSIPPTGFKGAFLEFHFEVGGRDFVQTTQVAVLPDMLPFERCEDSMCACKDSCAAAPPIG